MMAIDEKVMKMFNNTVYDNHIIYERILDRNDKDYKALREALESIEEEEVTKNDD